MSGTRGRRIRRVAVLIESSRAYGRGLIEGVARYSRGQGNWSICFEPRGLEAPPPWLKHWDGDGILTRLTSRRWARTVAAKGVPVVDLYSTATDTQLPMVAGDNERIARLAWEHLWERGLRQFGFCGEPAEESRYMTERGELFRKRAVDAGCPCSMFKTRTSCLIVSDWEKEQNQIATWLKGLPKPVGVMACFDERGFQVLNACAHAGLRVPEEVAVISVGSDNLLCELSTPPLSSIDLDAPRIGYDAAALLDRLMRGARPPRHPIRIEPRGLVARRSTDMMAFDDPDLAVALRFIRDHACDGIRVEDVVRHAATSSSVLERKFRRFLGRTPKAELLRVQIAQAHLLLTGSDLSLKDVAQKCGFSDEKYFGDAFFRTTGSRPGAHRRRQRVPG